MQTHELGSVWHEIIIQPASQASICATGEQAPLTISLASGSRTQALGTREISTVGPVHRASVRAPGTNLQEPAVAGEVERGREQLGRRRAGDGPGRRAGTSSILRSLTFHHLSPAPHTGTAGAAATLPITASDTAAAAVAAAALAPVPPPPRPPPDAALTPRGCRTDPPPPAARRRPRRGRSHLPG